MMNCYVNTISRARTAWLFCCIVTIAVAGLMGPRTSVAQTNRVEYRASLAVEKFSDTYQFAAALAVPTKPGFRADRLEFVLGVFGSSNGNSPFVSLGPVWQLPLRHPALFIEFGVSPTLLAETSLGGTDLGGVFHFTSSATLGATFGRGRSNRIALRIQHTSNGGLNSTNPGMDMIGINVAFDFGRP